MWIIPLVFWNLWFCEIFLNSLFASKTRSFICSKYSTKGKLDTHCIYMYIPVLTVASCTSPLFILNVTYFCLLSNDLKQTLCSPVIATFKFHEPSLLPSIFFNNLFSGEYIYINGQITHVFIDQCTVMPNFFSEYPETIYSPVKSIS